MEDTFCHAIVRNGGPMGKVPATNGSGRARKLKRHKMETIIPVPMIMGETVVGVLTLAHPEKIDLKGRLPKWAATLANYLATLTDRMRAEEVLHKRVDLYRELSKRIETAGATNLPDHALMELLLLVPAPIDAAAGERAAAPGRAAGTQSAAHTRKSPAERAGIRVSAAASLAAVMPKSRYLGEV